jgi:hypothetical protein
MKINRRHAAAVVLATTAASAQATESVPTHGPFLGHVGLNEVHIWARTARSGSFRIEYGLSRDNHPRPRQLRLAPHHRPPARHALLLPHRRHHNSRPRRHLPHPPLPRLLPRPRNQPPRPLQLQLPVRLLRLPDSRRRQRCHPPRLQNHARAARQEGPLLGHEWRLGL